jgi:hypothetical protein
MDLTEDNVKIGLRLSHKHGSGEIYTITEIVNHETATITVEWIQSSTQDKLSGNTRYKSSLGHYLYTIVAGEIPMSKPKEKACQSCDRMNDLGVKVCWYCGESP